MHDLGRGGRDPARLIAAVVIPWRDLGDRGECLRYSLRSLTNLPHSGVIVAGDPVPLWAVGLTSLVMERLPGRHEDAHASTLAALALVDGWAYIVHDDMTVMRPVDLIGPCHRGSLTSFRSGDYARRAQRVASWLHREGHGVLNFNVHLPFLCHAPSYLADAAATVHLPAGFAASVHGNLRRLRARKVYDPKVSATGARPNPAWPVWSTSDRAFRHGYVGKAIRQTFSAPGPYER